MIATDEIVEVMAEVEPGDIITYDMERLCSAFGIDDVTRIVVETDGLRKALITIYPSNPLADIRAVTREDLIMDRRGYIRVGMYHNGRLARRRLFDFATGSAQRFVMFGTTGVGKSRALQEDLAAEKINGIVSWVCDLKHGQSVPEAAENVDWYGTSFEEAILMLRAGVAVGHARMVRYAGMGRTAFLLDRPDPLLHVRIEEVNRLLEKGSPYRDEATFLLREIGRTGRSVGVGGGMGAQASHLEELGGSDTLRAMMKEGEVTLLRWSSSMMKQMVADGLLPSGTQLMPIPKTLAQPQLRSQFDAIEEDGDDPGTQGMAYLLSSRHPTSVMRHFRVGSVVPLDGLDPEILALYGDGEPRRLEGASHEAAGAAYAARHDPTAMALLCSALGEEDATPAAAGGKGWDEDGPVGGGTVGLAERILGAVRDFELPADAGEVLDAVNSDGGREVKLGSVRNVLVGLSRDGQLIRERSESGANLYSGA